MFHEIERLKREDHWEDHMASEILVCPHCHRSMKITAREDVEIEVTCKSCGKALVVVIKSSGRAA